MPPPLSPILRPFVRHCIEKKIGTYFLLNDITAVKVKVAISFLLKKKTFHLISIAEKLHIQRAQRQKVIGKTQGEVPIRKTSNYNNNIKGGIICSNVVKYLYWRSRLKQALSNHKLELYFELDLSNYKHMVYFLVLWKEPAVEWFLLSCIVLFNIYLITFKFEIRIHHFSPLNCLPFFYSEAFYS